MTNNLKGLKNIVKHKESIVFANGETTKSTFKGTYEGYINDNKIILHNVLTFRHLEEASSLLIVLVKDILKQFFIIKIIIFPLFIIKRK